ncbi:MAG TPA: hypothetical protein VF746_03035 [Longimicrobium sp.]|jgi:hypothetical protein
MIRKRELAAGAALALVVFSASFALARTPAREELDGALRLVAADPARSVCLGEGACVWPEAPHTLFVFFSATDCAGSLYDMAVLEELYRAVPRGRLNLVGVAYGMDAAEARAFAVASQITYPLYLDPARLERHVRNPRPERFNRPMKVLVDRQGRVIETWPSRTEVRGQRLDLGRVRARLVP